MAAEIKSHCRKDVCTIKYEMPAIIIVKSDSKEVCLRVTTSCEGVIEISDVDRYDCDSLNFEKMSLPEILEYSYIAKVASVSYKGRRLRSTA